MSSRDRAFVGLAALLLLAATMLGAYASHGLRSAPADAVDAVRTAVSLQSYHGLALLAVALLGERLASRWVTVAGWLFVAGTVLFCGAVYASRLLGLEPLGAVAPFGGSTLMAGWICVAVGAFTSGRGPS